MSTTTLGTNCELKILTPERKQGYEDEP